MFLAASLTKAAGLFTAAAADVPTPGDAAIVVLTGMVIVFAMLIVLVFIFWMFGKLMSRRNSKPEQGPALPAVPPPAAVRPAAAQGHDDGISGEVVAVIAAAVAAMAPDGTRYAVKSIARADGPGRRNAWAAAARAEYTRPF